MFKWNIEELKIQAGIIFKLYRLRKGLSQFQLENEVDISKDYIGLIERGKVNPTIEIIVNICNYLEVDITKIFVKMSIDERQELEEESQALERELKNQNKRKS